MDPERGELSLCSRPTSIVAFGTANLARIGSRDAPRIFRKRLATQRRGHCQTISSVHDSRIDAAGGSCLRRLRGRRGNRAQPGVQCVQNEAH